MNSSASLFPGTGEIELSPSILSADFSRLHNAVVSLKESGCYWVHCDVMDNHFVPNLTFGAPVVKALKASAPDMFYDVHLMIEQPEKWLNDFIKAGSDAITFHLEAATDVVGALTVIKDAGIIAGVSIKPATPLSALVPFLPLLGMVLIMTVEPGHGGQGMIVECLDKIRELKRLRQEMNLNFAIEVDGGINAQTVVQTVEAGGEILVAGSAIFNSKPVAANITDFQNALAPICQTIRNH